LKTIVKTKLLRPKRYSDNKVEVMVYEIEHEDWSEHNIRSKTSVLDKMLTHAQNIVSMLDSSGELKDKYVVVEVELPGLKAMRCEGKVSESSTILYPIPSPITRMVFLKKENEELKPVYTVEFKGENWVYDSIIYDKDLEYDAILVETPEDKRLVLKEELITPTRSKLVEEKRKKTRKRRRKKKKTTSTKAKKAGKKKLKKTKKAKKKKSKKKSKRRRKRKKKSGKKK